MSSTYSCLTESQLTSALGTSGGSDTLVGGARNESLAGGAGNDVLMAGTDDNYLLAGTGAGLRSDAARPSLCVGPVFGRPERRRCHLPLLRRGIYKLPWGDVGAR